MSAHAGVLGFWPARRFLFVTTLVALVGLSGLAAAPARADVRALRSGQWSDPTLWSTGTLPGPADEVQIDGVTVEFDTQAEIANVFVSHGGLLRFSRTVSTRLDLNGNIVIRQGSFIEVGTPDNPIPAGVSVRIGFNVPDDRLFKSNTLVGPDPNVGEWHPEDFGLWLFPTARGEFHGTPMAVTWTKLAADAPAGSTQLALKTTVDWHVGDTIVISATQPAFAENEVHHIAAVADNLVTLAEPLQFFHEGSTYSIEGRTIPVQAEVGNLTRNVLIVSNLVTEASPNHRAHTIFLYAAQANVSYCEFRDLGPLDKLGRYPVHYHMCEDAARGHFVRGISVWSTTPGGGSRFMSIHHSNGLTLTDSVGYNATGHGWYMESGPEHDNAIINNLGISVGAPETLDPVPDGGSQAVFWMRPSNTIQGNVAAGSPGAGFGFFGGLEVPARLDDAEAHSNGAQGLWVRKVPGITVTRPLVWRNRSYGVFIYGRPMTLVSLTAFGNGINVNLGGHSRLEHTLTAPLLLPEVASEKPDQHLRPTELGFLSNGASVRIVSPIFGIFERSALSSGAVRTRVENGKFLDTRADRIWSSSSDNSAARTEFVSPIGSVFAGLPSDFYFQAPDIPKPAAATFNQQFKGWFTTDDPLAGGVIAGLVLNVDGTPSAGARVAVQYRGVVLDVLFADDKGRYHSRGDVRPPGFPAALAPGDYELVAVNGGRRPVVRHNVRVRTGETTMVNFILPPGPVQTGTEDLGLTIASRSSAPGGRARPSVYFLRDDELIFWSSIIGGHENTYPLRGNYDLLFVRYGYVPYATHVTADQSKVVAPADGHEDWDPTTRGAGVWGRVFDAAGRPVEGVTLTARNAGRPWAVTKTQHDGTYFLNGFPAGTFEIRAARGGLVRGSATVTLAQNQIVALDFGISPSLSLTSTGPLNSGVGAITTVAGFDLNADGAADLFLYNKDNGGWVMATSEGGHFRYTSGSWSPGWESFAVNLNGDAAEDVFLYNKTTGVWVEGLNNQHGGFDYHVGTWSSGWEIYPADLTGDGITDILLYNAATGVWVQAVNDAAGSFTYTSGTWGPGWRVHPASLNGDGRADAFLYNPLTGAWARAINDGGGGFTVTGGSWSPGWTITPADLNGDGLTDFVLYSKDHGMWFQVINDGTAFSYSAGTWSTGWEIHAGDLNGDGRADIFLYNTTTGIWVQCLNNGSGGFTYVSGAWSPEWEVHVADLNGDGRADIFLYNRTTGRWFQCLNMGSDGFSYTTDVWSPGWTIASQRPKF